MAQPRDVDDRYTEGIWYDVASGDFCRIVRDDGQVHLETPDGSERYYTFGEDEEFIPEDYYPIEEEAIEYPDTYVMETLSYVMDSAELDPSFIYADRQVRIVKQDDLDVARETAQDGIEAVEDGDLGAALEAFKSIQDRIPE